MREAVTLECSECKNRNYTTTVKAKQQQKTRLGLSKFCRFCRKHTKHVERRK
jgi:large subunit ribosomal protein L33